MRFRPACDLMMRGDVLDLAGSFLVIGLTLFGDATTRFLVNDCARRLMLDALLAAAFLILDSLSLVICSSIRAAVAATASTLPEFS